MNRMIRVMSGVLLAVGAAACNNDASLDLSGEPTKIQASPQVMFATQGADENLYLRLTDDANYSVPVGPYTVSDVGPGLTVTWDEDYRHDYTTGELAPNPIQTQHHYIVNASQAVQTSFKVSNSGITQEITVIVVPSTLGANVSPTAPAIGDAVTLTLPANLSFTTEGDGASEITLGGDDVVVTAMTETSVTFVPFPGSGGAVEATNIKVAYSPTLDPVDLSSSVELTAVPDMAPLSLSATSAGIGDPVTITAGAGEAFTADATVHFPNEAGTSQLEAVKVSQTATTITVLPVPGSAGVATVDGVVLTPGDADVLGDFTLTSTEELTVPPVESIPLTFSNPTPAAGELVTISAAGVMFHPDLVVEIDGDEAFVVSVAADSLSAVILPPIGGDPSTAMVSNFNLSVLRPVTLVDVPSVAMLTPTDTYLAAAAGGTSLATAVPLSGAVSSTQGAYAAEAGPLTFGADVDYLGGGNGGEPRYYKLTVAEAGSYDISMGWAGGGDFDLYVRDDADGDVDSSPSGANPESLSEVELEAGTYYIVLHNWHGSSDNPESVLVTVSPSVE